MYYLWIYTHFFFYLGLKNTTHNQINSSAILAKTLIPTPVAPTPTITTKTSQITNNANLNDHQNQHHQQPQQINNNSVKFITASVNRLGLDEQNHLLRQQQFSSKLNFMIEPHVKALYDFTSKEVG